MGIIINELTVETKGNVVKNNVERDGMTYSVLRMTQDQARELNRDLTDFFARQDAGSTNGTGGTLASQIAPSPRPKNEATA